eukprot:Colp12_sorted_trinity150504_noHs@30633
MASEEDRKKNPYGIPTAVFVEDVDAYMKDKSGADNVLKDFDERYGKYKLMEAQLLQKKGSLKGKLPQIKAAVDAIALFQKKKESEEEVSLRFELAANVFAHAKTKSTGKVCLWLGANVMLEYDIDEAEKMLTENLTTAQTSFKQLEEDLGFLREQITIMEVNMARVYNWDVRQRRQQQQVKA